MARKSELVAQISNYIGMLAAETYAKELAEHNLQAANYQLSNVKAESVRLKTNLQSEKANSERLQADLDKNFGQIAELYRKVNRLETQGNSKCCCWSPCCSASDSSRDEYKTSSTELNSRSNNFPHSPFNHAIPIEPISFQAVPQEPIRTQPQRPVTPVGCHGNTILER